MYGKGYEKQREDKREEYLSVEEFHRFINSARDYIRLFMVIAVTKTGNEDDGNECLL